MRQKVRVQIFVSGQVQGVSFRSQTQSLANQLKLTGWVKNLEDGRLEILAEGEKENLEKLIAWVKIGPTLAKVEGMEIIWQEYKGEFSDFEIRYG